MKSFFVLPIVLLLGLAGCAGSINDKKASVCTHVSAGEYCIQSGDTLMRLSQRFRVSVDDLRRWNRLSGDTIRVGEKLIIRQNNAITHRNTNQLGNHLTLTMPVHGNIIGTYNSQSKGIDIAAPRGTFVHAAADGVVIYSGSSVAQYGKMLLVRHNATTITAYANNQNLLVPMNAKVKAGQIIAEVGDTGRRDGKTALHFEVRVNGKHVNPMNYFR